MFPAPNLDPLGIFVYSSITGLKINNFQTSLQRHVPVSNFWRLKLFASTETCKVPQTAALSCLSNQWRMFATCATVETDLFPKLKFYFQCNFSYKTKTLKNILTLSDFFFLIQQATDIVLPIQNVLFALENVERCTRRHAEKGEIKDFGDSFI